MKKYLLILLPLFCGCKNDKKYYGKVYEKYLLHNKTMGNYNIVFYSDSLHKFITVSVTKNTYVNTKVNDFICFRLSDYEIE